MSELTHCPWCGAVLKKDYTGRLWCDSRITCGYTRTPDGLEYRYHPYIKNYEKLQKQFGGGRNEMHIMW